MRFAPYAVVKVQKEREPVRSFLLLSYIVAENDELIESDTIRNVNRSDTEKNGGGVAN